MSGLFWLSLLQKRKNFWSKFFYYFCAEPKSRNILKEKLKLLIILLVGFTATAQNQQEIPIISDLLLVAENFATPGAEGAAVQASSGWFSSARPLDKWQVEVSVHGNALFVPKSKQNKLSSNSDFSVLRFQDGQNALLPTVFGGQTDTKFELANPLDPQGEKITFDAIDGLDKSVILHPFPQVTIGLPYSTEVALRFLPSLTINDVGFSTYGIGLKHNFTQYYERRFNPEDFQVSAVVTYSNFQADYAFNQIAIPPVLELNRIDVNADLWLFQALGSKLYDTFEVFGAFGVTASNFEYKMGGTGDLLPRLNSALTGISGSGTKFKGDIGFNYYFDKFKISTMFTAGSFFNANVGLHYRIR